jgi:hypothetical protein
VGKLPMQYQGAAKLLAVAALDSDTWVGAGWLQEWLREKAPLPPPPLLRGRGGGNEMLDQISPGGAH